MSVPVNLGAVLFRSIVPGRVGCVAKQAAGRGEDLDVLYL